MRTVSRFVQPFPDAAGGAGIVVLQAFGEIRKEPRCRLYVARLIGAPYDRLDPRALEAAVRAQPPALEIREQALTHRRVLQSPLPTARAHVLGHPPRSRAPPRGSPRQCARRRESARRARGRPAAPIARPAVAPWSWRRTAGSRCSCSCPGSRHRRAPAPGSAHTGGSPRPPASGRRRDESTGPYGRVIHDGQALHHPSIGMAPFFGPGLAPFGVRWVISA